MELNEEESKQSNVSPKEEQSEQSNVPNTSEETLTSVSGGEELDVDIIVESDKDKTSSSTDEEDPNATEYSSSFSDTASENACNGIPEEEEVESHYWDETDLGPAYDSFSSIFHFRKKRLTNHWRSFIRPLMWRSKWVELRIRELESRALEYPKELESYDKEKLEANIDPSVLETCGKGIKSLPFSNPSYLKSAAKRRRKRKKVEATDDLTSYWSNHNLFSYIETKRLSSDGMGLADHDLVNKDQRIAKVECTDDDEESLFNHKEGDSVLEEVLWKIELVRSQIYRLKTQVDDVMSKNAARFSSSENLSLLGGTSPNGGEVISIGAIQDYVLGDLVFSSASYGDSFHIPDIIESTVGLFADADVTLHHPQDILDNILIRNGVAEEVHDMVEEEGVGTSLVPLEQNQEEGSLVVQQSGDSVLRSCLASEMAVVPRNKRTRGGERKASSWCKKHLSDPDSQ